MTEVGGEAALYLDDPADAAGCARRIVESLGSREERAVQGLRQSARFDAAAMQAGYCAVLSRLVGERV